MPVRDTGKVNIADKQVSWVGHYGNFNCCIGVDIVRGVCFIHKQGADVITECMHIGLLGSCFQYYGRQPN